jgi:nitrite reductase/ring-hydroxylating ferredoxin subunit
MGDLMRQYWLPGLLSSELPEPDGTPLRLRLLAENLIAFRTTSGKVGLVADACPHRGASLFFGRNEEEGLRCVYHGWKFDVTGACVDMPSEPAESNFKSKVRARSYPCVERNGIVWIYMGSREPLPALPNVPPNLSPNCRVSKRLQECNFMQGLEGDIDTVHSPFLHAGHVLPEDTLPGSQDYYNTTQRWIKIEARDNEIGTTYGATRPVTEKNATYYRIGHFMLPFYTMAATGILGKKTQCSAWVPIDDEYAMLVSMNLPLPNQTDPFLEGVGGILQGVQRPQPLGKDDPYGPRVQTGGIGQSQRQFTPATSKWHPQLRAPANRDNDYCIDRDLQASMGTYTGVPRQAQDPMVTESMGPIYDRTQEHLATTDTMIIRTRRRLIGAAKALRDQGTLPPGLDQPELFEMYSGCAIVPEDQNGLDATIDLQRGRAQLVEIPAGGS